VWFDDAGPVAAVVLVDWGGRWHGLAPVVPGVFDSGVAWSSVVEAARDVGLDHLGALVPEDDTPTTLAIEQLTANVARHRVRQHGTSSMDMRTYPRTS
jgi:hypothetical protein